MKPLIFNLYKNPNMTSYDVVRRVKRILKKDFGKIGHLGTLDPFAEGVLLIAVGGAARLSDLIHQQCPKTYLGYGKLGRQMNTGDVTGTVMQTDDSPYLTETISQFDLTFLQNFLSKKFIGEYWQRPPFFSATKYQGRSLHQWAREGIEIKKEPVRREIYRFEIVAYQFPELVFRVTVSSGTYIRVLFEDIARELGTLGHLTRLVRESIGPLLSCHSITDEKLNENDSLLLKSGIDPIDLLPFPEVVVPESQLFRVKNGNPLAINDLGPTELAPYLWLKDGQGQNLGLSVLSNEWIKPKINFSMSR